MVLGEKRDSINIMGINACGNPSAGGTWGGVRTVPINDTVTYCLSCLPLFILMNDVLSSLTSVSDGSGLM